jgi:hypothetical protein
MFFSETRNIINEKFFEELIAYFLWYDTDRTENEKKKYGGHTDTQTARWFHEPSNKN